MVASGKNCLALFSSQCFLAKRMQIHPRRSKREKQRVFSGAGRWIITMKTTKTRKKVRAFGKHERIKTGSRKKNDAGSVNSLQRRQIVKNCWKNSQPILGGDLNNCLH